MCFQYIVTFSQRRQCLIHLNDFLKVHDTLKETGRHHTHTYAHSLPHTHTHTHAHIHTYTHAHTHTLRLFHIQLSKENLSWEDFFSPGNTFHMGEFLPDSQGRGHSHSFHLFQSTYTFFKMLCQVQITALSLHFFWPIEVQLQLCKIVIYTIGQCGRHKPQQNVKIAASTIGSSKIPVNMRIHAAKTHTHTHTDWHRLLLAFPSFVTS